MIIKQKSNFDTKISKKKKILRKISNFSNAKLSAKRN